MDKLLDLNNIYLVALYECINDKRVSIFIINKTYKFKKYVWVNKVKSEHNTAYFDLFDENIYFEENEWCKVGTFVVAPDMFCIPLIEQIDYNKEETKLDKDKVLILIKNRREVK